MKLSEVLIDRHSEAHELLAHITTIVDEVDPETADWGHAGNLGYIVEKLREITDSFQAK